MTNHAVEFHNDIAMAEYNDRNENRIRVMLVGLQTSQKDEEFERAMAELGELARASGMEPVSVTTQKAAHPVQATYVGSGKVEEIREAAGMLGADLVLFDQTLSPMQFRNLGRLLKVEVMDRTGLILRIFAEQARTREARLQVEHANLQYVLPRLAGMWTHFGRQAGGSGSRSNRGIGETQLELDRRQIEHRMAELGKELEAISKERETQRQKRLGSGLPRVALVGYTNAGKSTIMNRMLAFQENADEGKMVLEEDKLFATLDTTVRRISPKGRREILLSDTVGFINELPHSLVKAFRSTLEEVKYADLLVQVIDYSQEDHKECMKVTEETLKQIGASGIPMLYVYNKADKVPDIPFPTPAVLGDSIYMASGTGEGISELYDLIEEKLREGTVTCEFLIPYSQGALVHQLQKQTEVQGVSYVDDGTLLSVICGPDIRERYSRFIYPDRG